MTVTYKGQEIDFDAALDLMDDQIVEDLDGAVSTGQELMDAYARAHKRKYGEEFAICRED